MIKIQEHLNRADAETFLDKIAENHWQSLNQKLKNGRGFKSNSLIEKCRKYKTESSLKRYQKKFGNNNPDESKRHKYFFDYLLKSNASELKRLIVARPIEYPNIIENILKILHPSDLYTGNPGNYSQTSFGLLLSKSIFNYTAFRASESCKDLFTEIGFNSVTCPYCNDNKMKIVKIKNNSSTKTKQRAYLDLDHFYPKSQNPFLAVSFFNLIPTCHDCNSSDKRDKPFTIETHIHPYLEAFENFYKFKISLKTLLGDTLDNIEILKLAGRPKDITLDDLELVARYNSNLDIAKNLVTFFMNNKHYIGTKDEMIFTEAIFTLNGGVPKRREDILKIQKGKMSRDILMQIDINNI